MTNTVRKLLAAGAAVLVVGSITVATPNAPVAAQAPPPDHGWIDTTDRAAVLQSFVDEFLAPEPAPGLTGSVDRCGPISLDPAYRDRIKDRVDWYRAMAGTGDPIVWDSDLDRLGDRVAVWSSVNWQDERPHSFPGERCWSDDLDPWVNSESREPVLTFGASGPAAIDYQLVFGEERSIDRRRWLLLHPGVAMGGIGDAPVPLPDAFDEPAPANVVLTQLDGDYSAGPVRDPSGLVSWPPPGYFPGPVVPTRWSLHGDVFHLGSAKVWVDGVRVPAETRAGTSSYYFEPEIPERPVADMEVRVEVSWYDGGEGRRVAHEWTTIITGLRPKDGTYERARSSYRPVTPCRVADTRRGFGTPFGPNEIDAVQVTGSGPLFALQGGTTGGCGVPEDATAVEATLTAVNPRADGYARIGASDATVPSGTALMYTRGRNRASTLTIPLSPGPLGNASLWNARGTTDYALDVHGYYVPEDQPGLRYTPVTPCRAADTRKGGGALGTTTNRAFQVQGSGAAFTAQGGASSGCGIPADAAAVKTTITAVPTAARTGYLRTWASQTRIPSGSFLQHVGRGTTVTNTGNVAVGTNGKIALGNRGGSSHYMVDVVGYYSEGGAAAYTPIQACRAVDTRRGVGEFAARRRAFEVIGSSASPEDRAAFAAQGGSADTCDVPATATAVDTTVTALDPVGNGYSILWPSMTRQPTVRALNYRSGQWAGNTVAVPTGNQGRIALANVAGRTDYLLELTGYYEP